MLPLHGGAGECGQRCDCRPPFDDLAIRQPPQHETVELRALSGLSVGAGPDVADHDLVALGDAVDDLDAQVQDELVHVRHHRPITKQRLRSRSSVLAAAHIRWPPFAVAVLLPKPAAVVLIR